MDKDKSKSWFRLPYALLEDARLELRDVILYGIMLDHCTADYKCSISQSDASTMSCGRIGRSAFYDCLKRLEQCGYISHTRTGRKSVYVLTDVVGLKRQQQPVITQSRRARGPELVAHGTYQRVLLTAEQYSQLVSDYGRDKVQEYIQRCDNYCQRTGKHYADYDATIRQWITTDVSKGEPSADRQRELALYDALIN